MKPPVRNEATARTSAEPSHHQHGDAGALRAGAPLNPVRGDGLIRTSAEGNSVGSLRAGEGRP